MRGTLSRRVLLALAACLILGFAAGDVWAPRTVAWEASDVAFGAERAPGLVLQGEDGETLYATRGFAIYRSVRGSAFERVAVLRPRLGLAWGGVSSLARSRLRHEELVELVPIRGNRLLAFAGGDALRVDLQTGAQERVHELRYFGLGRGRGLMPHGLARDDQGVVYYGEYPTAALGPDETVRLWRSRNDGTTWEVAHEFAPGDVRHIHAVQWDPYGRALWVATGDRDHESRIGYSRDGGSSFTWIGGGSQTFRAVSLLFQANAVRWVMDTERTPVRMISWDRRTRVVSASGTVLRSPGYYTQSIDPGVGAFTLAERDASVWLVDGGEPRELLRWAVTPKPGLPHPSVRLGRTASHSRLVLHVNPLRTDEGEAAIYRVRLAPSVAFAPPVPR